MPNGGGPPNWGGGPPNGGTPGGGPCIIPENISNIIVTDMAFIIIHGLNIQ